MFGKCQTNVFHEAKISQIGYCVFLWQGNKFFFALYLIVFVFSFLCCILMFCSHFWVKYQLMLSENMLIHSFMTIIVVYVVHIVNIEMHD